MPRDLASALRCMHCRWLASLLQIACLLACSGCGSEERSAPQTAQQPAAAQPQPPPAQPPETPTESQAGQGQGQGLVRTDETGRKWIGDIPYDVWFDDPLAVA